MMVASDTKARFLLPGSTMTTSQIKALQVADNLKNVRVLWSMKLNGSSLDPAGVVIVWMKGTVVLPAKGEVACE